MRVWINDRRGKGCRGRQTGRLDYGDKEVGERGCHPSSSRIGIEMGFTLCASDCLASTQPLAALFKARTVVMYT